eukprot:TRINITY_DN4225_c0_g1_i8.p1 TRINITY_DN4225_c0_g1~~TRINITY_DN4225_c0_g1_i8.p1  ORF type:complete len:327 (-),score=27.77 TRINITY_DN4225_c0_g1_i8:23-859(-)
MNGNPRHSAPPSPLPAAAPLLHRVDTDVIAQVPITTTTITATTITFTDSDSLHLPFRRILTDTTPLTASLPSPAPVLQRVNTDIQPSAFDHEIFALSLPLSSHTSSSSISSTSSSISSLSQPHFNRLATDVVTVAPFHSSSLISPLPPPTKLMSRISAESPSLPVASPPVATFDEFFSPDSLLPPSIPAFHRINTDLANFLAPLSPAKGLPLSSPVLNRVATDHVVASQHDAISHPACFQSLLPAIAYISDSNHPASIVSASIDHIIPSIDLAITASP